MRSFFLCRQKNFRKLPVRNPPAFIPQTPFCGRENSAEVLPNPFPQKIVLAKPSPHLNSVSFSPRRNPTSLSPPPYRKNKKEIAPNQNRMRGGEARAERRSGNGAEHIPCARWSGCYGVTEFIIGAYDLVSLYHAHGACHIICFENRF